MRKNKPVTTNSVRWPDLGNVQTRVPKKEWKKLGEIGVYNQETHNRFAAFLRATNLRPKFRDIPIRAFVNAAIDACKATGFRFDRAP